MAAADAAAAPADAAGAWDCDGDAKFQAEVSVTRIMIDLAGRGMGPKGDDIPSSFRSFRKSVEPDAAAGTTVPAAADDGHADGTEAAVDPVVDAPFVVGPKSGK